MLNHGLEFLKKLEHFRSMKKKINPYEFTEIIYKENIVFLVPEGINRWASYI
jgi:hypothetical protein